MVRNVVDGLRAERFAAPVALAHQQLVFRSSERTISRYDKHACGDLPRAFFAMPAVMAVGRSGRGETSTRRRRGVALARGSSGRCGDTRAASSTGPKPSTTTKISVAMPDGNLYFDNQPNMPNMPD